jgi:hypothetical protein
MRFAKTSNRSVTLGRADYHERICEGICSGEGYFLKRLFQFLERSNPPVLYGSIPVSSPESTSESSSIFKVSCVPVSSRMYLFLIRTFLLGPASSISPEKEASPGSNSGSGRRGANFFGRKAACTPVRPTGSDGGGAFAEKRSLSQLLSLSSIYQCRRRQVYCMARNPTLQSVASLH